MHTTLTFCVCLQLVTHTVLVFVQHVDPGNVIHFANLPTS